MSGRSSPRPSGASRASSSSSVSGHRRRVVHKRVAIAANDDLKPLMQLVSGVIGVDAAEAHAMQVGCAWHDCRLRSGATEASTASIAPGCAMFAHDSNHHKVHEHITVLLLTVGINRFYEYLGPSADICPRAGGKWEKRRRAACYCSGVCNGERNLQVLCVF